MKKIKRINNLTAEQLLKVLDLFGAGEEEQEQEFIENSKGLRFMVWESLQEANHFDIYSNDGKDCFYDVPISDSELEQLAAFKHVEVEEEEGGEMTSNDACRVIFDNAGGITLQLGDNYAHYYSGYDGYIKQAAQDYINYVRDGNTDDWEGHEPESLQLDPDYDDIRNGGYKVMDEDDIDACLNDDDFEHGWENVSEFIRELKQLAASKEVEGAERLLEVEKMLGIDAKVYANVPDDAVYTVVIGEQKQEINLQDEDWEDAEELAGLIYDRLETPPSDPSDSSLLGYLQSQDWGDVEVIYEIREDDDIMLYCNGPEGAFHIHADSEIKLLKEFLDEATEYYEFEYEDGDSDGRFRIHEPITGVKEWTRFIVLDPQTIEIVK